VIERTVIVALLISAVAMVAGCGGASSTSATDGSLPTSHAGSHPSLSSIVTCLKGRGASAEVGAEGPVAGARSINGRLGGVSYSVIVTRSDDDARNVLKSFVGLSGASRTVNGIPVDQMLRRSGPIVVFYPERVSADVSRQVEACFGDRAQLDPDILASLKPGGCSGASGAAMAELARPETAPSWKPDHVEGGGCSVTFTTSRPKQQLIDTIRTDLAEHGWQPSGSLGEGFGLLYMTRGPLAAVLARESDGYSLYITPVGNLG
jgi:hypothetical protein